MGEAGGSKGVRGGEGIGAVCEDGGIGEGHSQEGDTGESKQGPTVPGGTSAPD